MKNVLQQIADDERRPMNDREAARRELGQPTTPQPARRTRRDTPMTQADQDADIENWLRPRDPTLTTTDRAEIRQSFDDLTKQILNAFASRILAISTNHATEVKVLIELHRRTQSQRVRLEATKAIEYIASHSPVESARQQAQAFLTPLKDNNEN